MENNQVKFAKLNNKYQECLNSHYDRFLAGENININDVCNSIKEEMKLVGNYYQDSYKEYEKRDEKRD